MTHEEITRANVKTHLAVLKAALQRKEREIEHERATIIALEALLEHAPTKTVFRSNGFPSLPVDDMPF